MIACQSAFTMHAPLIGGGQNHSRCRHGAGRKREAHGQGYQQHADTRPGPRTRLVRFLITMALPPGRCAALLAPFSITSGSMLDVYIGVY